MSNVSRLLINRAIADLERTTCGSSVRRAVNHAYATGMIEMAYAESLITDNEHDDFRRQLELANRPVKEVACA
ncbi:MAG: hypothetical protein ACKVIS_11000 [Pseudomonadales bacterium]